MTEAADSRTARAPTLVSPWGTGGTGTPDAIDAFTIRHTFDGVLWAPHPVPEEKQELVGCLLLGHVQLLALELTADAPLLQGAWRGTAHHVLASTHRMLEADVGTSQGDLYGLATLCRALLTLHQHAGPPTCLTGRTTESRPRP
ncbi:hypothetical protein [Streptomyces umbrinus]|uniref:hypothetical protein n=1 Tax=Streptomyces umbrinus TaxID=67370 RepID=UPI0033D406CB